MADVSTDFFDDYVEEADDSQINEYDLTSTPNDFNILTIHNFIESGAVKIPGFQRSYVWDIGRASKLVESLILGLPVPQIFLYEQGRNSFLVIDGQQRLMSIYYFMKQRFPRKERRVKLAAIFAENGKIPDEVLHDDEFFITFKLRLAEKLPGHPNKFKGLNYSTLGENKSQFDLRPIRNVIIKQNSPEGDDSSIYEIFNRLNSGGINLTPQEIRGSLYHSEFISMLDRMNIEDEWRRVLRMPEPDLHMKDVEILLRGFALLIDGMEYKPSMTKFLNQFSKKCKDNQDSANSNSYLRDLHRSFLSACSEAPNNIFLNPRNKKFNVALFEAVFAASCREVLLTRSLLQGHLDVSTVRALSNDPEFIEASQKGTTTSANVCKRLDRAQTLVRFETR